MERNYSFSNSLKDYSIGNNKAANKVISSNNSNQSWRSSAGNINQGGFGEDYVAAEFSWPPRSYTCSFCKREFRSAQALGGHMNVHRRDRARLRQSPPKESQPPFLNLNLNPNPNPNFSSSSSLVSSPFFSSSLLPNSSLLPSSPLSAFPCEMKKWRLNGTLIDPLTSSKVGSESTNMVAVGAKSYFGVKEFKDYGNGCINNNKFLKKNNNTHDQYVTLDLEIATVVSDSKEDLDLELRLGYS